MRRLRVVSVWQLKLLIEAVRPAYDDADVDAALVPDTQGIGSGPA